MYPNKIDLGTSISQKIKKEKNMDKLKFNEFGWIIITWMENGYRNERKFDTVSEAKILIKELKRKGLL